MMLQPNHQIAALNVGQSVCAGYVRAMQQASSCDLHPKVIFYSFITHGFMVSGQRKFIRWIMVPNVYYVGR